MSFTEFKEHNVSAGLGTALAIMRSTEAKYHIFAAVESLPPVFGTPETITFSSTTNMSVTNVQGKNTTENISVNIPYNIDNIALLDEVVGEKCKFAYIDLNDFSGHEFVAVPSYHLAEVGTSAIKTIVVDLAVASAKPKITQDLYDLFQDTITFDETIPAVITLKNNGTTTFNIGVSPSAATITVNPNETTTPKEAVTAQHVNGKVTITALSAGSCIVTIEATDPSNKYASNSRRIKVIVE